MDIANSSAVEAGSNADTGNVLIYENGGKDVLKIDNIARNNIALFMEGSDLIISAGKGDPLRIVQHAEAHGAIEKIEVSDGGFISANDAKDITKNMKIYAASKGIPLSDINDVRASDDLMCYIAKSWHEPKLSGKYNTSEFMKLEVGGYEVWNREGSSSYDITGNKATGGLPYALGTNADDTYHYGIDDGNAYVEKDSTLEADLMAGKLKCDKDGSFYQHRVTGYDFGYGWDMSYEVDGLFEFGIGQKWSVDTSNSSAGEAGDSSGAGNVVILEDGGKDTLIIDNLDKNQVAFLMEGSDLIIGTGEGDPLRIMLQAEPETAIERIMLKDRSYLTSGDVAKLTQDIASHGTDTGITSLSINVVAKNEFMMGLIAASWNDPR